jgi:hypothetical protein
MLAAPKPLFLSALALLCAGARCSTGSDSTQPGRADASTQTRSAPDGGPADPEAAFAAGVRSFVPEAKAAARVMAHAGEAVRAGAERIARLGGGEPQSVRAALWRELAANLAEKRALRGSAGETFPMSARELERTVVDYEVFKMETWVASGVFPKRYFGYFDEKWDTAADEKTLKETTRAAVKVVNAWATKKKLAVRATEAEVAVTFLAEGGAILLRESHGAIDNVHAVYGIGLDDIALGFAKFPDLVDALDEGLGTRLGEVVDRHGARPMLVRNLRYREAIAAVAAMWIYEKDLAARKLDRLSPRPLAKRSPEEQFVIGSLVYNSGRIFDEERAREIERFGTGEYLWKVSQENKEKRWPLPVLPPGRALERIVASDYPDQPTTWSAVYHVLQRWGAYRALETCSDVFDEKGMFRGGEPAAEKAPARARKGKS